MNRLTKIVAGVALAGALVAGGYAIRKADEYDRGIRTGSFIYGATPEIVEKEVENAVKAVSTDNLQEKP